MASGVTHNQGVCFHWGVLTGVTKLVMRGPMHRWHGCSCLSTCLQHIRGRDPRTNPCSREERAAMIIYSSSGGAVGVAQHACSVLMGVIPDRDPRRRDQPAAIKINMHQWQGCGCRSSSLQRTGAIPNLTNSLHHNSIQYNSIPYIYKHPSNSISILHLHFHPHL